MPMHEHFLSMGRAGAIPGHGDVRERHAKRLLRVAFNWIDRHRGGPMALSSCGIRLRRAAARSQFNDEGRGPTQREWSRDGGFSWALCRKDPTPAFEALACDSQIDLRLSACLQHQDNRWRAGRQV